jgi:hypothetical protein
MQAFHALRLPWSTWSWLVLGWALLSGGLGVCAWVAGAGDFRVAPLNDLLDWQPALWPGQPWRAWSAGLVHWSAAHLGLNLLACAVLIAWGHAAALGPKQTLAWFMAWPLTHALLAFTPSLTHYGGLSGMLHAGVSIGAYALVWHGPRPRRWVGILVLLGLAIKLAIELPFWAQWPGFDPALKPHSWPPAQVLVGAPGYRVASDAHLSGALSGLVCAWLVGLFQGSRRR